MNSFGAYVASEATVSVPLDLIAAGTRAATSVFALLDVELVVVVELLLLLPQPAIAATVSAGTPIAASSFLIGISSVVFDA
jgi:hypothetical protein